MMELYNSQQPTIFQREPTKLLPYESSNAVPAKMFATRCVRRERATRGIITFQSSSSGTRTSGQPNQRL
jgi:hypothetical protein